MTTEFADIQGSSGFDELRKHIKQGNEFCQQISSILHERADIENTYAKALNKLSQKISKVAGTCIGTLSDSWSLAGAEMEADSDVHKQLGQSLIDDLSKPIKNLADQQNKSRKPIESRVDKAHKAMADRRNEELKNKKSSFLTAKEREKFCEQLQATKSGKIKNATEKDCGKIEKKIRSLEDTLRKTDKEYLDITQKAEMARQEWELGIFKASAELQKIEEERIAQMQDFLNKYNSHLSVIGPKMIRSCDKLGEAVLTIDMNSDVRKVIDSKGTGPHQPEQILPDFYAEDMMNSMDKERRRQSLQNYLIYIQQDIEREMKGRDGVEKLLEVYRNKPTFADADAQDDSRQKLHQVNVMISFLEASHYKVSCAMAELDGRPKPSSKFQQYMERTKDKQGHTSSILRTPSAAISTGFGAQGGAPYRAPADGGHVETSYDDEFDDGPLCQCRAIYDYNAQQNDELTIKPGDIVTVFEKQVDGWWQGELRGRSGIFPATYVEELPGT